MQANRPSRPALSTQAIWLFFAKVISASIMLGVPMLLARALDQTTYGLYRQATLLLSTGIVVLTFGYIFSAYYYFPLGPQRRLAAALNIVIFLGATGTLALVVFSAFPQIVRLLLGGSGLVQFAPLFGVIFFLQCVGYPLEHFAIADGQFKLSTTFIISIQLSRAALLYGVALFAPTLRNLLLATAAQALIQVVAFGWYVLAYFPGCWQLFDGRFFTEQFVYVFPMALTGLLYMVGMKIPSYVVAHQFTPAEFAIYSIGCFEIPFIGVVREALGSVMIPRISELKSRNQLAEIRRVTAAASSKLAMANCAFIGVFLAAGPDFIAFLFSNRYLASWPIFAINLAPWFLEITLVDPITRAFPEIQRRLLAMRTVLIVVSTAIMVYYGPRFGMIFIVTTHVVFGAVERIYVLRLAAVRLRFVASELTQWRVLPIATVSAAIAAFASRSARIAMGSQPVLVRLLVCGLVFAIVYPILLWVTKALTPTDKSILRRFVDPNSTVPGSIPEETEVSAQVG
jgi:O-antigen/teichoic acid export membrane protein